MPRDVDLGYRTFGTLSAAGDNCVLLPGYYTGTSDSYAGWIGPGLLFDPERWFVVCTDLLGNGRSTSPSNAPGLLPEVVTVVDNVHAQAQLLDALGVGRVALAGGWSMGAMQALAWAAYEPDRIASTLAVCGTARCWPINQAFLAGIEPWLDLGRDGLASFGRAYAGWAFSAAFLRDRLHRELGAETLDDLLADWAADHETWHPQDLRTMLRTWRSADPGPDLSRITARTIYAPGSTDQYFTPPEAELEAAEIRGARVVALSSPWGHAAGKPGLLPDATATLTRLAAELLR